jgi:hypothetical protein
MARSRDVVPSDPAGGSAAGRTAGPAERLLDRWAGTLAIGALFAAAVAAALRVPYVVVVLVAAAGLGLLFAALALARKRTDQALAALSATWGARVVERLQEEGGSAWFAERGFSDYGSQVLRRMRTRTVDGPDGSVTVVDAFLGPGKPMRFRAAVLSTSAPAAGALCLYPAGAGDRRRARRLGGSVPAGGSLDERYVVFGADPVAASAAVRAIDPDAVDALFARMRGSGARSSPGFAVDGTRASVLLEGCPPAALEADATRETFRALRRCVRA